MAVDFVNRYAVVYLDFFLCEAVPLIEQILGLFVAHVLGVRLARQFFVVGLLHVVGVLVGPPFLLAFQSLLQFCDPFFHGLLSFLGLALHVDVLHIHLALDPFGDPVLVLFVGFAKGVFVAAKFHISLLDRCVFFHGREVARSFFKFF